MICIEALKKQMAFSIYKKFWKISIGNFRLERARSILSQVPFEGAEGDLAA